MKRLLSAATLAVFLIGSAAQAATYSALAALPFGKRLTQFTSVMDTYFADSQAAGGRTKARAESYRLCIERARVNTGHIMEDLAEMVAIRPDLGAFDVLAIVLLYLPEFCGEPSGMSFQSRRDRAVESAVSKLTM